MMATEFAANSGDVMLSNSKFLISAGAMMFVLAGCGAVTGGTSTASVERAALKACEAIGDEYDMDDDDIEDSCECVTDSVKALVKKDPALKPFLKEGAALWEDDPDGEFDTFENEYENLAEYSEDDDDDGLYTASQGAAVFREVVRGCEDLDDAMNGIVAMEATEAVEEPGEAVNRVPSFGAISPGGDTFGSSPDRSGSSNDNANSGGGFGGLPGGAGSFGSAGSVGGSGAARDVKAVCMKSARDEGVSTSEANSVCNCVETEITSAIRRDSSLEGPVKQAALLMQRQDLDSLDEDDLTESQMTGVMTIAGTMKTCSQ